MALSFFAYPFSYGQRSIELTHSIETGNTIKEKTILYGLAGNIIPIIIQQYGKRADIAFINLHDFHQQIKLNFQSFNGFSEFYSDKKKVPNQKLLCIFKPTPAPKKSLLISISTPPFEKILICLFYNEGNSA